MIDTFIDHCIAHSPPAPTCARSMHPRPDLSIGEHWCCETYERHPFGVAMGCAGLRVDGRFESFPGPGTSRPKGRVFTMTHKNQRYYVDDVSVGDGGVVARPAVIDRRGHHTVKVFRSDEKQLANDLAAQLNRSTGGLATS